MACPDYYRLAEWDGREFVDFYREECTPIVAESLNDSEKHALQSACEHLFRRGLKASEDDDLKKYRWWLTACLTRFQPDESDETAAEYADRVGNTIVRVLALVELRRQQKLGQWAQLGPMTPQDVQLWGYEEAVDDAS